MTELIPDKKFISKLNSGFPAYLDWEKLRAEGMNYIGKLSGKIWTDHNVHDPGITILEILCYALMDLGYRTNLPATDIFARDPENKSKENNFFTASEILSCNPLTITDFRKMLVDIEGVRNAWLEDHYYPYISSKVNDRCPADYNGLYHVYIEPETDDATDSNPFVVKLKETVRKKLMQHRNLCEDFIDIQILCKTKIGLCADIEIEKDADAAEVYRLVVEKLQSFFSPSPKFYTLRQLLEEKNKSIEEIFAGRPYNMMESHGFVDTEEFENLKLRKELHLSDVYSELLSVPGIRTVTNLAWRSDCVPGSLKRNPSWNLKIPENNTAVFAPECSVFQFTRNGVRVSVDPEEFAELFKLNFTHSGKVLYKMPSPYLDTEIPKGTFREDLDNYQSIQREFPRVYGINTGGLAPDVSAKRKSQAYQLKAYLLFFDQLLANYLAQLKNLRSLFSFSSDGNKDNNHTYFISKLTDAPDLDKLQRFNDSEDNLFGSEGSTLATPVLRKPLEDAIRDESIRRSGLESFRSPYGYHDFYACDLAMRNWQQDLFYSNESPVVTYTNPGCWFFYLATSSEDVVLLGKNFYPTEKQARQAADSIKYAGCFCTNYRSFLDAEDKYSFSLELRIHSYAQYLQRLVENRDLYHERRQQFLDHLLSRFSERFTDFAQLSFGLLKENQLTQKEIGYKENFLENYGEISSNRGKAHDYLLDGWNNENISGFERRVQALSGMNQKGRQYLCNFTVADFDNFYKLIVRVSDKDQYSFESAEKYYSKKAAEKALSDLRESLKDPDNYKITDGFPYKLKINYPNGEHLFYSRSFHDKQEAERTRNRLISLFDSIIIDPVPSYQVVIAKAEKKIAASKTRFANPNKAHDYAQKHPDFFQKENNWVFAQKDQDHYDFISINTGNKDEYVVFNWKGFKFHFDEEAVPAQYEISDQQDNFKFRSAATFNSGAEAKQDAIQLLFLLLHSGHSKPQWNSHAGKFDLRIYNKDELIALSDPVYMSKHAATCANKQIRKILRAHQYQVELQWETVGWKFLYLLADEHEAFFFENHQVYKTYEEADKAASAYYKEYKNLVLKHDEKQFMLETAVGGNPIVCVYVPADPKDIPSLNKKLQSLLKEKKDFLDAMNADTGKFSNLIKEIDDDNTRHVYRLVDKNNLRAFLKDFGKTEAEAKTKRTDLIENPPVYKYTSLVLGSNCMRVEEDEKKNRKWYYYQLKSANDFYQTISEEPQNLVLFESVKRYSSKEEALQDFEKNYLQILKKASDPENYGPDKFISPDPIDYRRAESCNNEKSVVYVPKETREELKDQYQDKLVRLARLYPVRWVTKEDDEFYKLFNCEPDERDESIDPCIKKPDAIKYYYFVLSNEDGKEIWQSTSYFKTHEQAIQNFHFFYLLLSYPGNYHIDQDFCDCLKHDKNDQESENVPCDCSWKIYIREVLAESKIRFEDEAGAWNELERFICFSQSENSFQAFLDDEVCSYTFDVSCGYRGLIHPCNYHTADERDKAIAKLFYAADELEDRKWAVLDSYPTHSELFNKNSYMIAKIAAYELTQQENQIPVPYDCPTDVFYDIFDNLAFYKKEESLVVNKTVKDKKIKIVIEPIDDRLITGDWLQDLCILANEYPVVKKKDGKYHVVIRLKGFGLCDEQFAEADQFHSCETECIAWESECCFGKCDDAWEFFERVKKCLKNESLYQPVFDCECGPQRIRLLCDCGDHHRRHVAYRRNETEDEQRPKSEECCNEIIAFNPQRYTSPKMDCEAIERAKRLINSEGLHLVEHILLIPYCPQDCDDENFCRLEPCDKSIIDCKDWTWKPDLEVDPCDDKTKQNLVKFYPGQDPYSFIATVFLPAWPERFRKSGNREIIENLLYRETPAHILLHIQWLNPVNFCRFETYYKNWLIWISRDSNHKCILENPGCEIINFIRTRFPELENCNDCVPCESGITVQKSCFDEEQDDCAKIFFRDNIDKLFCWTATERKPLDRPRDEVMVVAENRQPATDVRESVANVATEPDVPVDDHTADTGHLTETTAEDTTLAPTPRKYENGNRGRFFNSRRSELENEIEKVIKDDHPLKTDLPLLFNNRDQSFYVFSKLAGYILKNKNSKSVKLNLSTEDQYKLIGIITRYFLDKKLFYKNYGKVNKDMQKFYKDLRNKKFDTNKIDKKWYSKELDGNANPEDIINIRKQLKNK